MTLFTSLSCPDPHLEIRLDLFPTQTLLLTAGTLPPASLLPYLQCKPHYLDLPSTTDPAWIARIKADFPDTRLLLSHHDFTHTPPDLDALLRSMQSPFAWGYKIATYAKRTSDALRMLAFARKQTAPFTGLCMGPHGTLTRILGPVFGNAFGFTPPAAGLETAPGQLTRPELNLYRYSALSPQTALYGLIGTSLDQSFGEHVHNALIARNNWDAIYVKIPLQPHELPSFFNFARAHLSGLSVTMPYKEAVLPYIDHLDPEAAAIGAVNTLAIRNGQIYGTNTDGIGALDALGPVDGKTLLVLGAGGAARAIIYEARKRGAHVRIASRTLSRAQTLATRFHCTAIPFDALGAYDILVNTTPDPLNLDFLPGTRVFHIQNKPLKSVFHTRAEARGCSLTYGYEMYARQAAAQWRAWNNTLVDSDFMLHESERCAAIENTQDMQDIPR